jgi:hypothetical protein
MLKRDEEVKQDILGKKLIWQVSPSVAVLLASPLPSPKRALLST